MSAAAWRVAAVDVMSLDANGTARRRDRSRTLACDLLAMSGGWSPVVHLHAQSGGKPRYDDAKACFVPGAAVQAERSAGAANGSFTLGDCLAEGDAAGTEAARRAGFTAPPHRSRRPSPTSSRSRSSRCGSCRRRKGIDRGPKQFVDLQNDVAASDIVLAAREGYHSVEHVKRYTAMGFGTDQGKLGNINGMAILAQALGQDIASTGTTTFRPNYTPVTFGAIAGPDLGDMFDPIRKTALHAWHEEHGALFENVGQWKRPWYFPKPGEDLHAAVARECLAARNGVGIMDASTLGKIDIQGPDAVDAPQLGVHQRLDEARRRPLPLRPDARRERHGDGRRRHHAPRRAPLPDDHDHRRRGARDGVARALAADRMAAPQGVPHVGDRSLGDRQPSSAPTAARCCEAVCDGIDFSPEAFPFMSCARGHRRRRSGARDADQLLRRARLRGQRLRQRGAARVGMR